MKAAIFGGSGFIGRALTAYWLTLGHEIIIVTRDKAGKKSRLSPPVASGSLTYATWAETEAEPALLEGVETFVNLAGATLNQRWSREGKRRILESRLKSTQAVGRVVGRLKRKPALIVQGSAVGIYGTSRTETFDEGSMTAAADADFLAEVTAAWEAAADQGFEFPGIRLVKLRTGVVLGNGGGAYPLMRLPFLLGAGGGIGSGQQWVPWIHLRDVVALIDFCVRQPSMSGPVNAVSPQPVTNVQFGRVVSRIHRRPYWLPLPGFALHAALGEMSMLLLEGQKVIPTAALEAGFVFAYPALEAAVQDLKK
ncbi:TIGR01777 family oxidoreductase [Paenibacillus macerans]|uniref:TIGR01777 family oxidoreductase n=1 Tax=Paenibacillus macerans TaxID=44252 RepID=UPI003D31DA98